MENEKKTAEAAAAAAIVKVMEYEMKDIVFHLGLVDALLGIMPETRSPEASGLVLDAARLELQATIRAARTMYDHENAGSCESCPCCEMGTGTGADDHKND